MGFNKIEKIFKNFNVFDCHQGAKVTENKDFSWKWLVFCQNLPLYYTIQYREPNTKSKGGGNHPLLVADVAKIGW